MSHLTDKDRCQYTKTFLKLDLDQNGFLDMNELGKMMLSLGFDMPFSRLQEMFNMIDKDHNARITLDEFLAVMPRVTTEEERKEAKQRCDSNNKQ